MPYFGESSKNELETCDERLQRLAYEAIKYFDFTVVEGERGEREQTIAYSTGKSKTPWPLSKHNVIDPTKKSRAMDLAPYPIDWSDKEAARQRFVLLAGFMLCLAAQKGIKIRWGGDWNRNLDTRDEKDFRDYPHFELVED